jgi:predicted amidophosphoribosyltransferase
MTFFTVVRYRTRYYYRKTMHALGLCPDCFNFVNWTPKGKPICPECGK